MAYTTPEQPAPVAQQPRSSNTAYIVIGAVVGCGCLLLIGLAVAIQVGIIGGLWFMQQQAVTNQVTPGPSEVFETPAPTPQPSPGGQEPSAGSEAAALAWASQRSPGWVARVDDHTDDWSWVRLIMGPPESEFTTWLEIEWDAPASGYRLLDEGPIGYDGGDASAEGPGPTEAGAVQAALDAINEPTWVTRIQERSDDWRRVTVWAGPPQSEWVYAVTVEWDDGMQGYVPQQTSEVPYP